MSKNGVSTGTASGSSTATNIIDEFRCALLKNSTKTLTSEAEALLQHTFAKEWEQFQHQPSLSISIPNSTNQQHSSSPNKNQPSIQFPDLVDQSELEFMMGENTIDWVSSLYNKLPSHELNADEENDNFDEDLNEMDFFSLRRFSFSENQEDEKTQEEDQNKPRTMICAECGFVAGNRKQLWRHGKRENHTTRISSKQFLNTTSMKPKKEHRCEFCEYSSKSRFNVLRHHQRVHVNQKLNCCSICGKSFKDVDTLKTHIRYTHEKDRRFSCQNCSKQFVSSSDLQRHRRIVHEKIRDFICQKCNKRFQTSTNAKRHFHEVCGRETAKNPSLMSNMATCPTQISHVQY